MSYINNLHPHNHANIYRRIEEVITAAIPLWNRTLVPLPDQYYDPRVRLCPRLETFWKDKSKQTPDKYEAMIAELNRYYTLLQPFSIGQRFQRLQVIVKMEMIELTPNKPKFLGSKWQLDGILVSTTAFRFAEKPLT